MNKYQYENDSGVQEHGARRRNIESARKLGQLRLQPKLSNPDYLVLRHRKRIYGDWLTAFGGQDLKVLDIGGRIQPYRELLAGRVEQYVALDPQLEGLVDVIGFGENLPFADDSFDIIVCAQVFSYVAQPERVMAEIERVLRRGGMAIISAPAFFPEHHDERWHILEDGWLHLGRSFQECEVLPEGNSLTGVFRTMSVCFNLISPDNGFGNLLRRILIPLTNMGGQICEMLPVKNHQLAPNYCLMVVK